MNYYPLWHCLDDNSREALKPFLPKGWYEPSNTDRQKPIVVSDDSSEEYAREMKKKPGRD